MQRRLPLIVILVILAVTTSALTELNRPTAATGDPCDSYGNCIFSSISYACSNPDQSLYFGDEFSVILSTSTGPNTTSLSVGWSYDSAVLSALGGGLFEVVGNVTGTYFVTVTETFTVIQTVGNSTVTIQSPLSTSVSVETRAFALAFQTDMSNFTNPAHQVLRNPDGSFFHQDEFFVNYTYSFLFMQQRSDIKIVVEPQFNPAYVKLTSYSNSSSTGYFLFTVANSTIGPSSIALTAKAYDWQGLLLGSKTQNQPFAVVNYDPYFTYFTYMDYNSANSSGYERPFVTLIRYGGNDPGYSYGGNANTAPITNVNDTHERASINSFNFTVTGFGVRANLTSGDISQDISFWNATAIDLNTETTNATFPVMTFAQRIEKFYFASGLPEIEGYTSQGLEYFNVTELAVSKGFAGGNYGLFNTSYLYQPVYYNGYITVFTYGPSGLDPSDSVNISLVTPDPLDPHLLSSLNQTFGSSQQVARDFEDDLYPAYSSVMNLEPVSSSGGRWVFFLNDTNLATTNDTTMPYLYITVAGSSGKYSYIVPYAFSSFLINQTLIPSLPFPSVDGYYLDQLRQLVALPLNFSLSLPSNPYLAWDYNASLPSFISPVTYEPGNLSSVYGFLYGGNSTIYANLDGGGGSLVNIQRQQTNFQSLAMIGPQTGGVMNLWVKDPNGNLIINDSMVPNTVPPSPLGYYGFYQLAFSMSVNGTYQFGITNSWGVSSVFQTYDNITHIPSPPDEKYFLMTFFGFLVVGLYFLGKILERFGRNIVRPRREQPYLLLLRIRKGKNSSISRYI